MSVFSVTILGSNSAIPTVRRNPTAQIVNIHEQLFLVDCAEGTQLQLRRQRIRMQRINHIFISHLHGDHYFGLIGLLFTLHLMGRKKTLHLYGQKDLWQILESQIVVSDSKLQYEIDFHPLRYDQQEIIFENDDMEISSFPLVHSIPTCGFLFREKQGRKRLHRDVLKNDNIPISAYGDIKDGFDYILPDGTVLKNETITIAAPEARAYAFCSDTAYYEPLVDIVQGVDLLYHESTFMHDMARIAAEKFHATSVEAANIAKKAQVGKLLLGHFSARYHDLTPMLEEAKRIFPETALANDGNQFEL